MTFALLFRYWREVSIAVAVLVIVGACHQRDQAKIAQGRAEERWSQAESELRLVAEQRAKTDTIWRRDSIRVIRTSEHLLTLHDTVLAHVTDTLLVKAFIDTARVAVQACSDVVKSCDVRHRLDSTEIAALRSKLISVPIPVASRHCGLGGTIGVVAAYDTKVHYGPGIAFGIGCRL